ncbi:HSP40/DnaJ peptide-binding protein [bacterium]|nr:HSP40/DnaJ peptide-binding protein [bacterium]
MTISLEDAWRGTTRKIAFQRGAPGAPAASHSYDVKIPAGIREGQKIRLRGQGSTIGGRTGDILITIHIAPDTRHTLEGDNLVMELPLTPWEAALGANVSIQTLGGPVQVKVPAGIDSGKRLRVRGRGWPLKGGDHGDLLLRISIHVPASLSEQERDLLERLGKISSFNPRES